MIEDPTYSSHPAIAAAFVAINSATSQAELSAARDQLRKAELQRDIDLNFTEMWTAGERESAVKFGLVPA